MKVISALCYNEKKRLKIPILDPQMAFDIVDSCFEKVAHLKVSFSRLNIRFDFSIGVIDDGQKHVLKTRVRLA